MYSDTKLQTETLQKTKQALLDILTSMQRNNNQKLTQQCIHEIQMRLQPVLIDLKRTKIDIPDIALEANNPNCINQFNNKQYPIVENQFNKYKTVLANFANISNRIDATYKKKSN